MTPIFFPYTYLSRPIAEALAAFFAQITLYQPSERKPPAPMEDLAQSGFLDIRTPAVGHQNKFDEAVKDFQRWANVYGEAETIKTASYKDRYLSGASSSDSKLFQIIADLKREIKQDPGSVDTDPLFSARVFLDFAQKFDLQNDDIRQDLGAYDKKIQQLFINLKGDGRNLSDETTTRPEIDSNAAGEYMVLTRLQAWTYILQQDQNAGGLFVTSSRTIFDHIIDQMPAVEEVYRCDAPLRSKSKAEKIEIWQKNLLSDLEDLTYNHVRDIMQPLAVPPVSPGADPGASLTVCLIPGMEPVQCFNRNFPGFTAPDRQQIPVGKISNTLIGLIEF
jgi:hypothetical protein